MIPAGASMTALSSSDAQRSSPDRRSTTTLLDVRDVRITFGGIVALDGVSMQIGEGEICGLIGPNGAGKTTLFNCLSRLYVPTGGEISFDGVDLISQARHRMAGLGIGRTFQNLALFRSMTVLDNIMSGAYCRTRSGFCANFLRLPGARREEAQAAQAAREIARFLRLDGDLDRTAGDLSFGVQKRIEFGRALAAKPRLLLLDEPAAGLNHEEVDELRHLILDARRAYQLTVLLVEHHMDLVMRVSDHVVALSFGRVIADGTPDEVRRNPELVRAYLGGEAA
jgi:branched-chain amino acid transport system ATP-binding protein